MEQKIRTTANYNTDKYRMRIVSVPCVMFVLALHSPPSSSAPQLSAPAADDLGITLGPQDLKARLLLASPNNRTQSDLEQATVASPTAAVCFSGHVRTLAEGAADIERFLLQAFPSHESFFHLNLNDTYTSRRWASRSTDHALGNLSPVLKRLGSVAVATQGPSPDRAIGV